MIIIKDLYKSYGANQILKGIDLHIKKSEVVVVIGPSGSGKSTLLRCVNYLEVPTSGTITINNETITRKTNINHIRAEVGMVFQHFNLFPHMTVLDNITVAPINVRKKSVKEAEAKAMELLDRVGLADKAKAYPDQLSGGQQQRLCIARAIAMHPDVILMDEPTSALDPIATLKIEELIDSLKDEFTIIIVTHNMQQAARISDYTAFFMLGEIVEYSLTEDLFKNPQQKKTEDYITGRFG